MADAENTRPRRVTALTGTVACGPLGGGSKSAQSAVWINTAEGRYVLRRHGAAAIGDTSLNRFVGHHVSCCGFVTGYVLLAEQIEIVEPPASAD